MVGCDPSPNIVRFPEILGFVNFVLLQLSLTKVVGLMQGFRYDLKMCNLVSLLIRLLTWIKLSAIFSGDELIMLEGLQVLNTDSYLGRYRSVESSRANDSGFIQSNSVFCEEGEFREKSTTDRPCIESNVEKRLEVTIGNFKQVTLYEIRTRRECWMELISAYFLSIFKPKSNTASNKIFICIPHHSWLLLTNIFFMTKLQLCVKTSAKSRAFMKISEMATKDKKIERSTLINPWGMGHIFNFIEHN